MIRTMIVDDESLARCELSRLIKEESDFEVVGELATGDECLQAVKKEKVDVLFLDIDMPGMSGLEVASHLAGWADPPLVVFATAYHQYAVEAFEANAIDYILKPYDPARLKKTFQRVKELLKNKIPSKEKLVSLEDALIQKGILKKLVGHKRNAKDRIVIDPSEVYYFHAQNADTFAFWEGQELILNTTLKDLIASLDPTQFAQTHKAYIVNLNKVEKVTPMFSGNFEMVLKSQNSLRIPLSRRYASHIKSRLGSW